VDAVEIVRSPAANLPIDDAVTDRRSLSLHKKKQEAYLLAHKAKNAMPTAKFAISYAFLINE